MGLQLVIGYTSPKGIGGSVAIIEDPKVIAWYMMVQQFRPDCPECSNPLGPHGPAVPHRWRCFHCHTDHDINPT